jgi:hypothetical protein
MAFHLIAFGEVYPLDKEQINQSQFLSKAFSGKYLEQNRLYLNLDPTFKPAWDYIYQYLLGINQVIPMEHFPEIFQLTLYFDIQSLLDYLIDLLSYGKIPEDLLKETLQIFHRMKSFGRLPQLELF